MCEQVEALVDLEGEAEAARAQVKKLKEDWKKVKKEDWKKITSLHKKAKATEAVEERFERACQHVEKQFQAQLATERRLQLDELKRKAAFCTELEQTGTIAQLKNPADLDPLTVIKNNPADLNPITMIKNAWTKFSKINDADIEVAIEQRFQRAVAASGTELKLDKKALSVKETLCVRMEILAGVESPPEAMPARLAYQVSRLSAAMSNGEKESINKPVEVEEIERSWCLSSAVSDEQMPRLEQRFSKACEEFYLKK